MNPVNWSQTILDPQWMRQLEHQARQRFVEPVTAEEACSFVLEKLADDDWARCKTYKGQAKVSTFLYSLSARLLEEFSRQRYGRARPPAWLSQQGEFWVGLWKSICLERNSSDTVIAQLTATGRHEKGLIQNIIRTIKARLPWCGVSHLPVPEEYLDGGSADSLSLEDKLSSDYLEEVLASIAALLGEELDDYQPQLLEQARQSLSLDNETLLMLQLHFQEGLSFSAIARALAVPNHQPGRQIKKGLQEIHRALEQSGLHLTSALDALEQQS